MTRSAHACLLCLVPAACISEQSRPASDTADSQPADGEIADGQPADDMPGADAESCSEPGVTRCAEDLLATESCVEGVWQRAPCGASKMCVIAGGAQCVDSTGDKDCRDTFYCFVACQVAHGDDQAAGEACFIDCFRHATPAGQFAISDTLACIQNNCSDSGFDCVAERCSQDLADCYFDTVGDRSCGAIIECRLACADDASCAKGCGGDATFESQGQYAVLELCAIYACTGQDAACMRRESLPTGACGDYANECVGLLPSTPR